MKVACIQINSGNDMKDNLKKTSMLCKQAAKSGAKFILTPENVALMAADGHDLHEKSYSEQKHPALAFFCKLAKEIECWILVGSIAVKSEKDNDKLHNRSFLINDMGKVVEHYDKIHLYDVEVQGGERHNESNNFLHGSFLKMAETPWGKLGMTVCYDVRFPHIYRALAKHGADFIAVPSAFTKFTGQAHWETLLRARAIENGCYILAPAQTGSHPAGRKTHGHSMIIDPWGEILAKAGEEEGFIIAEIDKNNVHKTRASLPSLQHDRDFTHNN